MTYQLPKLKYPYNAMEPEISAEIMELHYSKHHQAYTNNLNAALEKFPEYQGLSIYKLLFEFKDLPEELKTAVRNNGGGYLNHNLFWEWLSPVKNVSIPKELESKLVESFGSVQNFKEKFETAAKTRFGSGWAWLVYTKDQKLEVISTANQDSPLMDHKIPLLGLDVWEHSYYLQYKSARPEYVSNFWKLVDWNQVWKKLQEAESAYSKEKDNCSDCCCSC